MTGVEPPAIRVEGISKQFRIGGSGEPFFALRDVSFEVARGEAVGIIGRNGAGKSTLLKVLSRITAPSEGRAEIRGRVGSLLEVGTGFHPELTGRENIFLNGAVLCMRGAEIRARFDEIVAFSGVEAFLDTPVKRYSSGMRVRLAFAVAAHLEPEVLIIDEVLAVGDAEFQKRCLGKMSDVAGAGRTVLFVSHDMAAVRALCSRVLWLEDGRVAEVGAPDAVIGRYLFTGIDSLDTSVRDRTDRQGNGALRFTHLRVLAGDPLSGDLQPTTGEPFGLALAYSADPAAPPSDVRVAALFDDLRGNHVFVADTRLLNADFPHLPPAGELVCEVPRLPLAAGRYCIRIWATVRGEVADHVENAATFTVSDGDFYRTGRTTVAAKHGPVVVEHGLRLVEKPEDLT